MKIFSISCEEYKMFNPTTGEVIVDEECRDNAKSLIAYWLDDFAHFNDEVLMAAWKTFEEKNNKGKANNYFNWKALTKFIKEYDTADWVAYKITSYGCGNYTVLYIVDKDVIVKEINEDEMEGFDHFIIT